MPAPSLDFWWTLIVGTVVLLTLGLGIIAIILVNHRRFLKAEREKIEEIRRHEQNYTDLFNSVSDLVYVHSLDTRLVQINAAVTRQLGYAVEELIGKTLTEIFGARCEKRIDTYLDEVQRLGESSGLVYLKSKDRGTCIFEYRNSLITKNGEGVAVRGIARDVTKQREAEAALRRSELRFRDLFDNAPDIYLILAPDSFILDFNQRGLEQLGYQAEEAIGRHLEEIVHPQFRKRAREVLEYIHKKQHPPKNIEICLLNKAGESVWVSTEFSLLQSEGGHLQAIRVVCRNVTERKRLQEELARAQRLESAGRVAGQIAHDFNNLLAPLAAYPPLLREDLPPDHPALEMIEEIEFATKQIADINQQLLALGRRGHYAMEPIDLNRLVQKVMNSVTLPKGIRLELHLDDDLLKIKGGAAQLSRVITNLIFNAKEAMQGIGALTIATDNIYLDEPLSPQQKVPRGEYVRLTISDTGAGIEKEVLDKIFDPFFTTKNTDRMRGSGLGLSIVHGIVEDHHGYIEVESQVGVSTTFKLYFPTARDLETEIETKQDAALVRGKERVLVVDDDPVQRKVAEFVLGRMGYEVDSVASGEEALTYVEKTSPDLLILDMVMNGIDGTETYRQVLERRPGQRAIITSGYAMSKRVEEALRLGAGSFVSKPLTPDVLLSAVRQEIDRVKN